MNFSKCFRQNFYGQNVKVQAILVLENKKINDHKSMRKTFHLNTQLIFIASDIDKAFGRMYESVMTKLKIYSSKY